MSTLESFVSRKRENIQILASAGDITADIMNCMIVGNWTSNIRFTHKTRTTCTSAVSLIYTYVIHNHMFNILEVWHVKLLHASWRSHCGVVIRLVFLVLFYYPYNFSKISRYINTWKLLFLFSFFLLVINLKNVIMVHKL